MSKINVNNIEANDASTDITVTTGGSQSLLVDTNGKLTVAGNLSVNGNNYPSAGPLSNRNLIINGAMQVAQRGTSVSGYSSVSDYPTCDRMEVNVNNLGAYTVTQEADSPVGFSSSLKLDCTTADASPASTDYVFCAYKFEGQDVQMLQKGTSDAKQVTLSFWIKSNLTGTFQVNLRDADNSRYISSSYTVSAGGTWEYKTITFSGDTTGVLDNDANESLKVEWWLDSGSNFNSGSLNTSWAAASNANRNAGTTVNIGDSTSNYWQITGVQLEVGDSATPFEHRSYGDELARCQRYYEKSYGTGGGSSSQFDLKASRSDRLSVSVQFKVEKRASPALALVGASNITPTQLLFSASEFYVRQDNSLSTTTRTFSSYTADAEL